MNERKPQPAWRKKEGGRGSQQRRSERRPDQQRDREKLIPLSEMRPPEIGPIEVTVRNGDVSQALRILKTKMSKEGLLSELKRKRHAEKPSEKKRRKHREAMKRMRKSKGKRRKQDWWKRDGKKSKVASSVPIQERRSEENQQQEPTEKRS